MHGVQSMLIYPFLSPSPPPSQKHWIVTLSTVTITKQPFSYVFIFIGSHVRYDGIIMKGDASRSMPTCAELIFFHSQNIKASHE